MGLKIVGFLPPTAYIMLGTREALKNVEKSYKILYSSEYLPVYKTSAFFRNRVSSLEDKDAEISLRLSCKENLESVKQYLSDNGASEIVTVSQNPPVLEAKVPSGLVGSLAKRSDVLRVGPKPKCQVFNDVAKTSGLMNVDSMQHEGYTGKGVTVAVADTGFDRGNSSGDVKMLHPDFSGKSIQGKIGENNEQYRSDWADYHGHGTHVSGSATAKSGHYLGTAPDASLYIIAIGSNKESARLSGVNVIKYQMMAYIISGFFTGLAGIAYAATFSSSVAPGTGPGLELDAIGGAIIGGTSMTGGQGSVIGTLLGVFVMSLLKTGLPYVGLQANWQQILTGIVLIVAIYIDVLNNKKTA